MKIIRIISIILSLLLSVSLYSQNKMSNNIDDSKIALQGYSPVSYLDLGLAQLGSKSFKSEYQGILYYFTSEKQKSTFDKSPSKYLPQYGGFCAFGAYAGAKFRVNPNKFLVSDGKYYLYLANVELDALELWLAEDHQKLKSKADENWLKLSSTYN